MSEAEKAQVEADLKNKVIFSEEADVLGTADLAPTNAQFIGALDGSIEGQEGLTFSADSKIAVFKFRFDQDTKRGQKIVSYLAWRRYICRTETYRCSRWRICWIRKDTYTSI